MSPPSAFPSQESTDSLLHPDSPAQSGPANAQETTRNRIIREIVETERKYVQDLEHMQVRGQPFVLLYNPLTYGNNRNMQMPSPRVVQSTKTRFTFSSRASTNYWTSNVVS